MNLVRQSCVLMHGRPRLTVKSMGKHAGCLDLDTEIRDSKTPTNLTSNLVRLRLQRITIFNRTIKPRVMSAIRPVYTPPVCPPLPHLIIAILAAAFW